MLTIYLDENIVSYLKSERYKTEYDALIQYKDYFIFSYSKAHILDLKRSNANTEKYKQDIATISQICGQHYLDFDCSNNTMYMRKISPERLFCNDNIFIELFNKGFEPKLVCQYLRQLLGDELYNFCMNVIGEIPFPNLLSNTNDCESKNCNQWLSVLLQTLSTILTDEHMESIVLKSIRTSELDKALSHINRLPVNQRSQQLKQLYANDEKKDISKILKSAIEKSNFNNDESVFIAEYVALALNGYSRDKKKSMVNIITDAIHAYYASYCDMLVTNDEGVIKKAQLIYAARNIPTKICRLDNLESCLKSEYKYGYSLSYIARCIIPQCHLPINVDENRHNIVELPSPIFGLYRFCGTVFVPEKTNMSYFYVDISRRNGLDYFELEHFFNLCKSLLHGDIIDVFTKEVEDKYATRDTEIIKTVKFQTNFHKWNIMILAGDKEYQFWPLLLIEW
ncbi:MAG: hypothetical protein MJY95_07995 [Bacteroidaceae bacterium]|nr:hypothetical protein [Bacteroidaceae bacterium]